MNASQASPQATADRRASPQLVDREIAMPMVPQDIFRRKLAHRALGKVEAALHLFDELSQTDYTLATEAGYLDIAVHVMRKLKREELAQEFEARRQEVVLRAITAKPVRRRKRKQSRPRPEHQPGFLRADREIDSGE